MQRILVPAHFLDELSARSRDLDVELVGYDAHGETNGDPGEIRALFRWWLSVEEGDRVIERHPELRWIHSGSAGVDHILTPLFRSRALTLTNSSGVHAPSIAEWVVATMLYLEKDLGAMLVQQHEHRWEKVERPELSSRTVAIIGAGSIATEIARPLRAFHSRLIAVRKSGAAHEAFDEVVATERLREAASRADWLIIAVPLSSETRHLVDAEVLKRMKSTARVINVARGEIIDEAALIDALQQRSIAGAVLDVLEHEPPPADHPLWDLDNVMLLPHTTWRSPEVRERQIALFLENLRRFVSGEPLQNVVSPERGY